MGQNCPAPPVQSTAGGCGYGWDASLALCRSMTLGGGLLCIKLSKASPKEWKGHCECVCGGGGVGGEGTGILPLCRSTGLASGVGKAALEYQALSDSLHGAQERVGGTKAALPPWLCH